MSVIPFYQVDAFAERPLTGNPAAVMPLERWLDDAQLQAIAAENNLSETAFTVAGGRDQADFELRWFTPTTEVELCGHATLAAGHVLIAGDRLRFATRSGLLSVARASGGLLELELPAVAVEPAHNPALLEALGLADGELLESREKRIAIAVLRDETAVRAVTPDFAALAAIDRLVAVTARGDRHAIASRVFAAAYGIDEDPVTGSAHAALVPLWASRLRRERFDAWQASRRGGLLHCRLAGGGTSVVLGGRCFTVIEGVFRI